MEIKVEHLCKTFGRQKVLKDLSLTIPTGIYGLLGKNGAGKKEACSRTFRRYETAFWTCAGVAFRTENFIAG